MEDNIEPCEAEIIFTEAVFSRAMCYLDELDYLVSDENYQGTPVELFKEVECGIFRVFDELSGVDLSLLDEGDRFILLKAIWDKIAYVLANKFRDYVPNDFSNKKSGVKKYFTNLSDYLRNFKDYINGEFPELRKHIDNFLVEFRDMTDLPVVADGELNIIFDRRVGKPMSKTRANEIDGNDFKNLRVTEKPSAEIIAQVAEVLGWGAEEIDRVMAKINPDVEV